MKMHAFVLVKVFVVFSVTQLSNSASIRNDNDNSRSTASFLYDPENSSKEDLVYSEISSKHQEARDRLYRQLRQYGVPSDVAQMYVPRGMTVGELFGNKDKKKSDKDDDDESTSTFDPWSIVWYIGSFGGLIAFFLVISCSEWCCLRSRSAATLAGATPGESSRLGTPTTPRCPPNTARHSHLAVTPENGCETPPPAYHLFAPPSYDFIFKTNEEEKQKYDVFVVPVHSVPEVMGSCLQPEVAHRD